VSAKIGSIQAAQEVLDRGFYGVPQRRRIDATSANLVVQVAAKLNEKNRAHLDGLTVHKAALLCWKLVGK
jgi:hypothetical protein